MSVESRRRAPGKEKRLAPFTAAQRGRGTPLTHRLGASNNVAINVEQEDDVQRSFARYVLDRQSIMARVESCLG